MRGLGGSPDVGGHKPKARHGHVRGSYPWLRGPHVYSKLKRSSMSAKRTGHQKLFLFFPSMLRAALAVPFLAGDDQVGQSPVVSPADSPGYERAFCARYEGSSRDLFIPVCKKKCERSESRSSTHYRFSEAISWSDLSCYTAIVYFFLMCAA